MAIRDAGALEDDDACAAVPERKRDRQSDNAGADDEHVGRVGRHGPRVEDVTLAQRFPATASWDGCSIAAASDSIEEVRGLGMMARAPVVAGEPLPKEDA